LGKKSSLQLQALVPEGILATSGQTNHLKETIMSETVCHCMDIDRDTIVKAIKEQNLTSVEEVQEATTAGTGCGSCVPDIEALLAENK